MGIRRDERMTNLLLKAVYKILQTFLEGLSHLFYMAQNWFQKGTKIDGVNTGQPGNKCFVSQLELSTLRLRREILDFSFPFKAVLCHIWMPYSNSDNFCIPIPRSSRITKNEISSPFLLKVHLILPGLFRKIEFFSLKCNHHGK